ncbi:MAG TPA: DUF1840 domain-containing protein [Povalibacter sp.]|nr:DUF1840 domain-containing protein [Povalibacter sp.]
MLVTFRSTATDSITMFGDTATQLLDLMGASGRVPGAFTAADVPAALQRLEAGIGQLKSQSGREETAAPPADNEDAPADAEEEDREPPVQLAVRAIPLIGLLRRAAAAKAEVMWEARG